MKFLNIYPVESFFALNSLDSSPINLREPNFTKRTNQLFWSILFSEQELKNLIHFLADINEDSFCDVPQYSAIIENPSLFLEKCQDSIEKLFSINIEPRHFFSACETLQIVCTLYSDLIYNPFKLHLNGAFILPEYSSSLMIQDCLDHDKNPYLDFINEHIWPAIKAYNPDVVLLHGGIRFSNLAQAMMLKNENKHLHVVVTRHQNEYYSLNKLSSYLSLNRSLFQYIDSIILDDFPFTEGAFCNALKNESSLFQVPNLLFAGKDGDVHQTEYQIRESSLAEIQIEEQFHREVYSLKLWPNNKCYWASCSFCSINEKYHCMPQSDFDSGLDEQIAFIKKLVQKGVRYLLMSDEAIPPKSLLKFARALLENNIRIFWESRSKIDADFTPELIQTLFRSGLRRIMIGLESANPRILKLMNKFPVNFEHSLIEKIASYFNDAGIIIHYCTIIGFPSESYEEMQQTLDKIEKLRNINKNFVFNINIFNLDIGSKLFNEAKDYEIEAVWPCPPEENLAASLLYKYKGNEMDRVYYENVKTKFSMKNMFPWVPETVFSDLEIIDYCSTMNNLIWFSNNNYFPDYMINEISPDSTLLLSDDSVFVKKPDEGKGPFYAAYNWHTHYQWTIDQNMYLLLQEFIKPGKINDCLISYASKHVPAHVTFQLVKSKLIPLLKESINRGFLIEQLS